MSSGSKSPSLPRRSFSSEPVHLRLAELCRKSILEGRFSPGDRFPSEREIAERHEVSRATANKVISTLVAEGLLELKKGIGSRVCRRKMLFASLPGMESFTAHARERGMRPATQVLQFEHLLSPELPPEVKKGLGFSAEATEAEPVIFLERLRLADDIPMIHESRWIRESLASGLTRADVDESFYRILEEKYALVMTGEEHRISAVLLDSTHAGLLSQPHPAVALQVEGTGFIAGETPLWYQKLLYHGEHYQLHNKTSGPSGSAVELRLQQAE